MSNRRALAWGAVSAVVLAGGLGLSVPGSRAVVDARVSLCAASQLSPIYVNSTGAAGSRDREYGFKNLSTRRCELTGYPTVRMLTRSGRALSTTELHAPGAFSITPKLVTLGQKSVAYFAIHYAAATGYANLKCPTSAALRLTAPGDTTGLVLHGIGGQIQPYGGTIEHLHCGIVHVSAVTAKRFQ